MCSLFFVPSRNSNNLSNMEQNFQGDLTDILRGSATNSNGNNSGYGDQLGLPNITDNNWHFSSETDRAHVNHSIGNITTNFPSLLSTTAMEDHQAPVNLPPHMAFGDPFSTIGDPLLHDHAHQLPGPATFFAGGGDTTPSGFFAGHALVDHHVQEVKFRPSCNVFSRMLQINTGATTSAAAAAAAGSPNSAVSVTKQISDGAAATAQCDDAAAVASPRGVVKAVDSMINVGGASQVAAENMAAGGGLQISSPRNPDMKRRKSQAKKVVCIPAPAAANSRASGEVVPSDLWAWRKYGQKPIKGSPYPRGYYRCSSSKGCSARKQVERSRTDPNMLVITYTSEHNHPWPAQRNALAGSTRSQLSKATNASAKTSPILGSHNHQHAITSTSPKEELANKIENNNNNASASTTSASVKEENIEKLDDDGAFSTDDRDAAFGYRPALCSNDVGGCGGGDGDQDAFFAELGEIEADPLNLLFDQSFSASPADHHHHHQQVQQQHSKGLMVTGNSNNSNNKGLDFAMFDWSEDNNSKQRE